MTRHEASSTLPAPSAQQLRHSTAVIEAVRAAIHAQGGWLGFEQYLRIVLYAPGLGYYAAGSVKFGHSGDFVTAPEISGLYARCVASQCAQVLRCVGGDVLEFGAGTGRLAAGVLSRLAELGPMLGAGKATAVALVSRVLMTAGDLITAGAAAALARRPGREAAP